MKVKSVQKNIKGSKISGAPKMCFDLYLLLLEFMLHFLLMFVRLSLIFHSWFLVTLQDFVVASFTMLFSWKSVKFLQKCIIKRKWRDKKTQGDSQSMRFFDILWAQYLRITQIHWKEKRLGHFGFPFSDFQLKSFVDLKPVELWESAIHQKFCLSLLVWLQK